MKKRKPADEIIDMSSGPFRCTVNYSLLARIISWRRALGWLQGSCTNRKNPVDLRNQ